MFMARFFGSSDEKQRLSQLYVKVVTIQFDRLKRTASAADGDT
ncbi:hypothetical protein RE6C_04944 [Rhodopirellula europaea 6C]|uniref:Uncharacterized protein n=1 Tax=Rhodopirellula europaea 6C TaxID=1263867 RepID=M2AP92_9BACT|nr:hypothetical protein RE6C_04944 [Rhodopirellula europaea 6C]